MAHEVLRAEIAARNAAAEAEARSLLPNYPVTLQREGMMVSATPDIVHPPFEGLVVLYIHGGAFVRDGGAMVELQSAIECLRMRCVHIGVDYRMPPDYPFPAGVDDCVAAYRSLIDVRSPQSIVISGVSSGAVLALAILRRGLPMPGGLMLDGPFLDLAATADSFDFDPAGAAFVRSAARLYSGGASLADPAVSPLFGPVCGFPPTFIQVGERDVMLSDATAFHHKLEAAGRPSQLTVVAGAKHGETQTNLAARRQRVEFLGRIAESLGASSPHDATI